MFGRWRMVKSATKTAISRAFARGEAKQTLFVEIRDYFHFASLFRDLISTHSRFFLRYLYVYVRWCGKRKEQSDVLHVCKCIYECHLRDFEDRGKILPKISTLRTSCYVWVHLLYFYRINNTYTFVLTYRDSITSR